MTNSDDTTPDPSLASDSSAPDPSSAPKPIADVDQSTAEAREMAQQVAGQAREMASDAIDKVKRLDSASLGALGALMAVLLLTFLVDMASFSVYSDTAISETMADAERSLEARMNSWSYSAFGSGMIGKLMWLSTLAAAGLLIYGAITQTHAAWLILAQAGAAALACLLMLLLFLVGFPDLQGVNEDVTSNVDSSATLLGYWLPLLGLGGASFLLIQRIVKA